jgi:predicted nuclease of restriction endonuclease-like (RecB) superfamily
MIEKSELEFVLEIKTQIKNAQYRALQKVNKEQIKLYWNIGKSIVEKQQQFGWGKSIVELLAKELQKEFIGINGFSARNLWRMKTLYEQYSTSKLILPPLVAEIPWTHNIIILEKCKDEHERFYYINMTKQFNWTKAILINAIDNQSYHNTLISQHNFKQTLTPEIASNAQLLIKDQYIFDFLNLSVPYSEAELEQAILTNIRNFLLEIGGDFSFIGNQFPLKINDKLYTIDLLLYHRALQCLVAIELKIDTFQPEYAGKMNFYLSALNQIVKKQHENPSIGIIICKSKDRTTVEFSLQDVNKPIGVATYNLSKELPKDIKDFFPSNEELINKVEAITLYLNKIVK